MKRIALLALTGLILTSCAQAEQPDKKTADFLAAQFVDGQYLPGLSGDKPDLGFTLEALAQLSQSHVDLKSATAWVFAKPQAPTSNGLAGKLLFAAHTLGIKNSQTKQSLETLIAAWFSSSPTTPDVDVFSISWQVLGLAAWNGDAEARNAASVLGNLRQADGGWGGTDATAIALMAFESVGDSSSANMALQWLKKHEVKNHFEAYGDIDVNGTAYAIMALDSAGTDVTAEVGWLRSRITKDGGISTPWSKGKGDIYATAQGYLALTGSNYAELAKK